jgi:hypothetical protein
MNLSCRDGPGMDGTHLGLGALSRIGHDRPAHDIGIADKN